MTIHKQNMTRQDVAPKPRAKKATNMEKLQALELHERIKLARDLIGLKKTQFAKELDVDQSAVRQWEKPRSENGTSPKVPNLIAIAVLCNISFEWLATGRGEIIYRDIQEDRAKYSADRIVTNEELDLIKAYRELGEEKKNVVKVIVKG